MAGHKSLCERCSRINLQAAFDRADNFRHRWDAEHERLFPTRQLNNHDRRDESVVEAVEVFTLHNSGSWDEHCPLCEFLQATFVNHLAQRSSPGNMQLFAFSSLQRYHLFVPMKFEEHSLLFFDRAVMALMTPSLNSGYYHLRDSLRDGAILRVSDTRRPLLSEDDGIWGRKVPEIIDFDLPRHWLEFCCCHHLRACARPQTKVELQGFRVINCMDEHLTVEEHPMTIDYVALSYVWGSKKSDDDRSQIPNVVMEAILATKKLGFEYLWVDRLCIDHQRNDEKMFLISHMDRIYQQAELTIVAAAPDYDGLPGVNDMAKKRTKQPHIRLGDMHLVSSITDPVKLITQSPWHQRGWTFQEGILSRRLLVFTNEQLYWSCCGMTAQESIQVPANLSHLEDRSNMGDWMSLGPFHGYTRNTLTHIPSEEKSALTRRRTKKLIHDIAQDIEAYTQRTLKHDSDSLLAFKGVMQLYQSAAIENVKFVLGLPICLSAFRTASSAFASAITDWSHDELTAENGRLCWRRPHLPSWTWAGWGGTVSSNKSLQKTVNKLSSIDDCNNHRGRDYTPKIHVRVQNGCSGSNVPLENWLKGYTGEDAYIHLRIQQPYTINPQSIHAGDSNKIRIQKNGFYIPVCLTRIEALGSPADRQATVIQRLRDGSYIAVLVWWDIEDLHGPVSVVSVGFLLLRPSEEQSDGTVTYERIGSLCRTLPSHQAPQCTDFDGFICHMGLVKSETDIWLA